MKLCWVPWLASATSLSSTYTCPPCHVRVLRRYSSICSASPHVTSSTPLTRSSRIRGPVVIWLHSFTAYRNSLSYYLLPILPFPLRFLIASLIWTLHHGNKISLIKIVKPNYITYLQIILLIYYITYYMLSIPLKWLDDFIAFAFGLL